MVSEIDCTVKVRTVTGQNKQKISRPVPNFLFIQYYKNDRLTTQSQCLDDHQFRSSFLFVTIFFLFNHVICLLVYHLV